MKRNDEKIKRSTSLVLFILGQQCTVKDAQKYNNKNDTITSYDNVNTIATRVWILAKVLFIYIIVKLCVKVIQKAHIYSLKKLMLLSFCPSYLNLREKKVSP